MSSLKLNRERWIIAVLSVVGGIRIVLFGFESISFFNRDDAALLEKAVTSCSDVLGDKETDIHNDFDQDDESSVVNETERKIVDLSPTPSVSCQMVPGQGRCLAWAECSQKIRQNLSGWKSIIWLAGPILGLATLFMAFLVLKRRLYAGKAMIVLSSFQVLAAVGTVFELAIERTQNRVVFLALWPELENVEYGWLFINANLLTAIVMFSLLCLFYLGLTFLLNSKKFAETSRSVYRLKTVG